MQVQPLGGGAAMVSWGFLARRVALQGVAATRRRFVLGSGEQLRLSPGRSWLQPAVCIPQLKNISTAPALLKDEEVPMPSPLSQVPMAATDTPPDATGDAPPVPKPKKKFHGVTVRATKTRIAQSPTKMNLVAKVVRGMRVEDALIQMKVLIKKAAETVHEVLLSARANAIHNRGYNPEKLIVAEAFVGKGEYLKRIWPHGKGRSGIRERKRCRLTVVVREMTPFEEKTLERLKEKRRMGKVVRRSQLLPHRIIEARWSRPRMVKQDGIWTELKPKPAATQSTWN